MVFGVGAATSRLHKSRTSPKQMHFAKEQLLYDRIHRILFRRSPRVTAITVHLIVQFKHSLHLRETNGSSVMGIEYAGYSFMESDEACMRKRLRRATNINLAA